MSKRLSAEERKQQIVASAITLFSTQGLNGTTTRQIAEAAGITEAVIYKHFKGKDELYQEALKSMINALKQTPFFKSLFKKLGPVEIMREAASNNLKFMDEHPQFTRLLLYSGLQQHELSRPFFESIALPLISLLSDFIGNGQTMGRVREDIDPLLSTLPLVGSMVFLNIARNIFRIPEFRRIDVDAYVENTLAIYTRGISASEE